MFKRGQKVVFIGCDISINPDLPMPIRNKVYTFNGYQLLDTRFLKLKEFEQDMGFIAKYFRPIVEDKSAVSDLVNSFKEVEEKSDIQIEELV